MLVALMVPRPGAAERVSEVAGKSGAGLSRFDVVLPNGRLMSYRATTKPPLLEAQGLKAEANSLLVILHSDGGLSGIVLGFRLFEFRLPSPPWIPCPLDAVMSHTSASSGKALLRIEVHLGKLELLPLASHRQGDSEYRPTLFFGALGSEFDNLQSKIINCL